MICSRNGALKLPNSVCARAISQCEIQVEPRENCATSACLRGLVAGAVAAPRKSFEPSTLRLSQVRGRNVFSSTYPEESGSCGKCSRKEKIAGTNRRFALADAATESAPFPFAHHIDTSRLSLSTDLQLSTFLPANQQITCDSSLRFCHRMLVVSVRFRSRRRTAGHDESLSPGTPPP